MSRTGRPKVPPHELREQVSLRLPARVIASLRREARRQGVTRTRLAADLIEQGLARLPRRR